MPQPEPPLVTAVIPTFRRPQLLERAIESVLRQSFARLVVAVYDNASGDETASIVAALQARDPRVRYHAHDRNLGAAENIMYGVRQVHTPYFSVLSDDDELLPNCYAAAVQALEANQDAAFAATHVLHLDGDGHLLYVDGLAWPPGLYQPPGGLIETLKRGHMTWTGTLFRRYVAEPPFGFDPKAAPTMDLDLILRVVAHRSFVILDQPGARFLFHDQGASMATGVDECWASGMRTIEKIEHDAELPEAIRGQAGRRLRRALAGRIFRIGRAAIRRGMPDEAHRAAEVLTTAFRRPGQALLLDVAARLSSGIRPLPLLLTVALTTYRRVNSARLRRQLTRKNRFTEPLHPGR